jgi:SAM-dependent methyltransferase
MNLIERATILHYHRHREETYTKGTTRALGWKNDDRQLVRYKVLLGIGDLNGCSILDPGCGYGDLLGFLSRDCKGVNYTGLELVPEFLEEAVQRYSHMANSHFYFGGFSRMALPRVDYVLASGALGYKTDDVTYCLRCLDRFYRTANKGVAFNMLDGAKFSGHPLLTGHDKEMVVAFCRSLCKTVEVMDDYLEDDFTVYLKKTVL